MTRMPLGALLALTTASFITILTEALPAGLLPQMAASLAVSEAAVGQLVTVYAIGSLLAAIPLTAMTRHLPRRPLVLAAIAGFALSNTFMTLSSSFAVLVAARFVGGVSAGLLWALLAGYAARMAPPGRSGQAIAIAMAGTPLALSLGVPLGAWTGSLVGWRTCFAAITVGSLVLIAWARIKLPALPGQAAAAQPSLTRVLGIPGVRPVLSVVLAFVLAHNIMYTYIAAYLARAGMAERVDLVLLVFGFASLVGIWMTGVLIDRYLRGLSIASTVLFGLAAVAFVLWPTHPVAILAATGAWGLAFGGSATLFQTALTHAAGASADVAQSMLVTGWNIAIAGGGIVGGILLDRSGAVALAPALLILLSITLVIVLGARAHGFPACATRAQTDPR